MTINNRAIVGLCALFLFAATAAADEKVEIFNGSDLSGWTKLGGAATYAVENGVIVGRSVPNTSNTFLATDREFADFVLELDFKIDDPKFNSGIQIRSHSRPTRRSERVYGYQVEIDPKPRAWTAGIYFEGGSEHRKGGWLNDLKDNQPAREAFRLGKWNHVRIVAVGRHIQTWLNGVAAADYTDTDEKAFTPSGFIALQVHGVGGAIEPKEVRWKNIELTVLEGNAPHRGEEPASNAQTDTSAMTPPTALRVLGRIAAAMFGLDRDFGGFDREEQFVHLLGRPAPNFELETVSGEKLRLQDLAGQVVVLDFWATWCGPCVAALPELEKVHTSFQGQKVTVIGVNQQDDRDAIQGMIERLGMTFTHVMDTDGAVANSFAVSGIPQTVIIDSAGVVQKIHVGYSPGLSSELSKNIRKLLGGENLYDEQEVAEARAKQEQEPAEIAENISLQID